MANLGFQTVLALTAGHPGWTAHRAFADRNRTLEGDRPLAAYDVVALSLSFEGDYAAALRMLRTAGIPLRASRRTGEHPLVLAGGVAPTLNPEPLAPFVDVFFLGEAESGLSALLEALRATHGLPRAERLAEIARMDLPGVYVPSAHRVEETPGGGERRVPAPGVPARVARAWAHIPWDPARTRIALPDDVFQGAFLLEIGRGCPHACRFCATGYGVRPFRPLPIDVLLPHALRGARELGRVGFVAAAVSDHPHVLELARAVLREGAGFTVSSFRAENLTPEAAELLARGGTRTLTVALEAGSGRLRQVIGKRLSREQFVEAARTARKAGLSSLRIYAMVGLPAETDEDVEELALLAADARKAFGGTVTLSVAPFVPKPHTPFQWEPMAPEALLRSRIRKLQALCGRAGVHAVAESPKWARVQALLSRGGRQVGELLEAAVRTGDWRAALRAPLARRVLDEPRDPALSLPWDFVAGVPSREHLLRERRAAEAGEEPTPCRPGRCRACGLCPGSTP